MKKVADGQIIQIQCRFGRDFRFVGPGFFMKLQIVLRFSLLLGGNLAVLPQLVDDGPATDQHVRVGGQV